MNSANSDKLSTFWTHLQHLNAWRLAFGEDERIRVPLLREIAKNVPSNRGSLEFLETFSDDRFVLLLTHDLDNRAALQNEAWLTLILAESGAIRCFGAEGAPKDEDMEKTFAPHRRFPDHNAVEIVAEYLLWEGKLGSVGYVGLMSKQPVTICGIEDAWLYELCRDRYSSEYWKHIDQRVPILLENLFVLMKEKKTAVVGVTLSPYNFSRFHELLKDKKVSHAGIRASLVNAEPERRPHKPFRTNDEALASGRDPASTSRLEELFSGIENRCLSALNRPEPQDLSADPHFDVEGSEGVASVIPQPTLTKKESGILEVQDLEARQTSNLPVGSRSLRQARAKQERIQKWGPWLVWSLVFLVITSLTGSDLAKVGLVKGIAYGLAGVAALTFCFLLYKLRYGVTNAPLSSALLFILNTLTEGLHLTNAGHQPWVSYSLGFLQTAFLFSVFIFVQRKERNSRIAFVVLIAGVILWSFLYPKPPGPRTETVNLWQVAAPILIVVVSMAVVFRARKSHWLIPCMLLIAVGALLGLALTELGVSPWISYSLSVFLASSLVCLMIFRSGITLSLEFKRKDLSAIRTASGIQGRLYNSRDVTIWSDREDDVGTEIATLMQGCQARFKTLTRAQISSPHLWVVFFGREDTFVKYSRRLFRETIATAGYYVGLFRKRIVVCRPLAEQWPSTWRITVAELLGYHLLAVNARTVSPWVQAGISFLLAREYRRVAPSTDIRLLRAALSRGQLATGEELLAVAGSELLELSKNNDARQRFVLQSGSFIQFLSEMYPEHLARFIIDSAGGTKVFGRCFHLYPNEAMRLWVIWLKDQSFSTHITPDPEEQLILDRLVSHIVSPTASDSFRRDAVWRLGESGFLWGAEALLTILETKSDALHEDALHALENLAGERKGTDPDVWREWLNALPTQATGRKDLLASRERVVGAARG